MSGNPHRLAEAANNISNHLNEAPKTSPQEDEFLTDLTKAQIAAISQLMKSKDTNKLKAYLVSQKMVDKNFEDIKGYKMDRDVLSVLQRSFKDYHEQTENNITNNLDEISKMRRAGQTIAGIFTGKETPAEKLLRVKGDRKFSSWAKPHNDKLLKSKQSKKESVSTEESFASGKAEIKRQLAKEKGRSNNTGTPTPIRLGAGRPAGAGGQSAATAAMKKFRADFDKLEDRNAHGEAALLLAKFMGHSRAVKCIELVNKIHEIEGSIPYPVQQYRDQWSQRLWADFDKNYPNERFQ